MEGSNDKEKGNVVCISQAKKKPCVPKHPDKTSNRYGDIFDYVCPECENTDFNILGIEDSEAEDGASDIVKIVCANEECCTPLVGSFVWYVDLEIDDEE